MPPATLQGVSVNSLLRCFVIFAVFKESMNLSQRSFKVIHFGGRSVGGNLQQVCLLGTSTLVCNPYIIVDHAQAAD